MIRRFFRASQTCVLTVLNLTLFCFDAFAAETPNILFIFADDWGRMASAYAAWDYGPSDVVSTPILTSG